MGFKKVVRKQKSALVTGAEGMLADALCPLLEADGYKVYPTDVAAGNNAYKMDVRDKKEVMDCISNIRPGIIFHLAAETNVDKCQLNKEHAFETNFKGTENIALASKELGIPMVYVSTAAVFDGEKLDGYTELDKPGPISIYGDSKLRGELAVASLLDKYYIVRAGWMIGGHKKDKKFVWKIIQLFNTSKKISVVTDKIGSPTFTKDFSKGLLAISKTGKYGIYHCANKGICSRFDIARKVVEYLGRGDIEIEPVTSEAFPLPAPRGKSEALINRKLSEMGLDHMRLWQDALKEYMKEYIEEKSNEGVIH